MTEFYTYIHAKPDGSIFYVGKGCGGRSHMLTQRSQHHRRMIKKYGVRIFVFPCDSEEQAFAAKKQAAALTADEKFARASAASKAHWDKVPKEKRVVSAEVRAKISASRKGTPAWNKGISPSDEVRAKMSESGKKKVMTAEHKAKIVAAQRTPEMRARQAAAKIGHTPWNKGIKNTSLSHPESSQETATLSSTQSTILSTTKFNTTT